jgi:hypothetical protein
MKPFCKQIRHVRFVKLLLQALQREITCLRLVSFCHAKLRQNKLRTCSDEEDAMYADVWGATLFDGLDAAEGSA